MRLDVQTTYEGSTPEIYIQAPDGREIYRGQADQEGGNIADEVTEAVQTYLEAEPLADRLAKADDLEAVKRALVREELIRHAMTKTGETREIVESMMGAVESMDQEAVLDLMDGEPTTLVAAIARYAEELEGRGDFSPTAQIVTELGALLAYPWPGLSLEIEDDNHWVAISVGGREVFRADRQDNTLPAVSDAATAVHGVMTTGKVS